MRDILPDPTRQYFIQPPSLKLKILDRTLTFISLSIYPKSIHPFLNLFDNPPSVHSSMHPFDHRSVCQSICTTHPPIHPSMHSSIYSFIKEAERQTVSEERMLINSASCFMSLQDYPLIIMTHCDILAIYFHPKLLLH